MSLTLCSNCRLPVNVAAERCPLCTAPGPSSATPTRRVPVVAAAAVVATLAMLTMRRA